jgi:hypothetical protein
VGVPPAVSGADTARAARSSRDFDELDAGSRLGNSLAIFLQAFDVKPDGAMYQLDHVSTCLRGRAVATFAFVVIEAADSLESKFDEKLKAKLEEQTASIKLWVLATQVARQALDCRRRSQCRVRRVLESSRTFTGPACERRSSASTLETGRI